MAEITSSNVEYKYLVDDAWYGVELLLQDETLILKYIGFSNQYDEMFHAKDFKDEKDVEDLKTKFRLASIQLQDKDCKTVNEGKVICASSVFRKKVIKFYDAIVESVKFKDHNMQGGEELCNCKFKVIWQHGPNEGKRTIISVENICLHQYGDAETNLTLAYFLNICRQKIEVVSQVERADGQIPNQAWQGQLSASPSQEHEALMPQTTTDDSERTHSNDATIVSSPEEPHAAPHSELDTFRREIELLRAQYISLTKAHIIILRRLDEAEQKIEILTKARQDEGQDLEFRNEDDTDNQSTDGQEGDD